MYVELSAPSPIVFPLAYRWENSETNCAIKEENNEKKNQYTSFETIIWVSFGFK